MNEFLSDGKIDLMEFRTSVNTWENRMNRRGISLFGMLSTMAIAVGASADQLPEMPAPIEPEEMKRNVRPYNPYVKMIRPFVSTSKEEQRRVRQAEKLVNKKKKEETK